MTDTSKSLWPEIGDIVVNHGAGKPQPVGDLDGRTLRFTDGQATLSLRFTPGAVEREDARGTATIPVEVFRVRPDIYFIDGDMGTGPKSLVLIVDLSLGRVLVIDITAPVADAPEGLMARLAALGSQSAVGIAYWQGHLANQPSAPKFEPSRFLIGKQFRYRYSDTHLYDHIYISDRYYTWFCRSGPDANLGDFDECDYFEIGPELVLVCWREKLLPCTGITLEDHQAMRTVGKIFGADSKTGLTANSRVGADIRFIADVSGEG